MKEHRRKPYLKNAVALLAVLLFAFLLPSCADPDTGEEVQETVKQQAKKELVDTHSDDGRTVVGISMPSDHIERWHRDGACLKQQFEEKDYEVLLNYAHDKIDIQMQDIEQMVEQGADVLIIAPVDSSALTEVLKDASAVNIPIIVTGQDGDEENLKAIMDGRQSMTVYRALDHEAMVTAQLVEAIFQDEPVGEKMIEAAKWDFPCVYDTQSYDNGKKTVPSFLLEPTVITKENMQAELIDTGFYQMGEDGYPVATR